MHKAVSFLPGFRVMRSLLPGFALLALVLGTRSASLAQSGIPWAWGDNGSGKFGDDTLISASNVPIQPTGMSSAVQVSGSYSHSLFLKSNGTVWGRGYNAYGELGNGTFTSPNALVQVSGLTGAVQVSAGEYFSLAVKSDGTVWGWGYNEYGKLGDGTHNDTNVPVQVSGLTGAVQVSAGQYFSLAVKSDGTVWGWGYNGNYELGDGTPQERDNPVQASGLTGVIQASAGLHHSLAVKSDGTVWAWGLNGYGSLGDGLAESIATTPVQVPGLTGVVQVVAANYYSLALKSDGTVWAWGWNVLGELGDGTADGTLNHNSYVPVPVSGLTEVAQISTNYSHTLAVKSDGTVWAWGENYYGELGDGTRNWSNIPVQVVGLTGQTNVAMGYIHSLSVQAVVQDARLNVSNLSQAYSKPITLSATLKSLTLGGTVINRQLTFSVDGVVIGSAMTSAAGKASLVVPNPLSYAVGAHSISVAFAGDSLYNASAGTGTLTITKANTSVSLSNLALPYGAITLSATLKNASGGGVVAKASLVFLVDGGVVGLATTNAAGKASLAVPNSYLYAVGAHNYSAQFAGDGSYNSAVGAGTLTITKADTWISLGAYTARPGDTKNFAATLKRKPDNTGLVSGVLTFKVDGVAIGNATTDASGKAVLSYKFGETYNLGAHTLTAEYAGNGTYNASAIANVLTVAQAPTSLGVTSLSGRVGATVILKGKLIRTTDSALLSGRPIAFQVDGIEVGTASTASGIAALSFPIPATLAVGAHSVKAVYSGEALYTASLGEATLTVSKAGAGVSVPTVAGRPGDTKNVMATLKRKTDGAALSGQTMTFKIDGVAIGTAVTDGVGVATLPYKFGEAFNAGNHVLKAEFAGDASHTGAVGTGIAKVYQAPTKSSVSSVSGRVGATVLMKCKLTRTTDGALLSGKAIRFQIDGMDVGTGTTAAGIAPLSFMIPSSLSLGAHTITVLFDGDPLYAASIGTATLTVK